MQRNLTDKLFSERAALVLHFVCLKYLSSYTTHGDESV